MGLGRGPAHMNSSTLFYSMERELLSIRPPTPPDSPPCKVPHLLPSIKKKNKLKNKKKRISKRCCFSAALWHTSRQVTPRLGWSQLLSSQCNTVVLLKMLMKSQHVWLKTSGYTQLSTREPATPHREVGVLEVKAELFPWAHSQEDASF